MKVQEIIDLIDFISKKRLDEVKLETSDIKLAIKKNGSKQIISTPPTTVVTAAPVAAAPAPVAAAPAAPAATPAAPAAPAAKEEDNSKYVEVKSPMIGTFYRSQNPESPKFVEVGDTVAKGQTVCIVEAMKLFNEIESEVSGTIVKVLVDDASPVEFDQPLFLVDPS